MNRKKFLETLSWLIVLPFILLASWAIRRHTDTKEIRTVRITQNIEKGITFLEEIIILRQNEDILFFSSKCPHLGCRINAIENNEFVCPCHGSRFSLDGINVKGPANRNLKKLNYSLDQISGEYIINI